MEIEAADGLMEHIRGEKTHREMAPDISRRVRGASRAAMEAADVLALCRVAAGRAVRPPVPHSVLSDSPSGQSSDVGDFLQSRRRDSEPSDAADGAPSRRGQPLPRARNSMEDVDRRCTAPRSARVRSGAAPERRRASWLGCALVRVAKRALLSAFSKLAKGVLDHRSCYAAPALTVLPGSPHALWRAEALVLAVTAALRSQLRLQALQGLRQWQACVAQVQAETCQASLCETRELPTEVPHHRDEQLHLSRRVRGRLQHDLSGCPGLHALVLTLTFVTQRRLSDAMGCLWLNSACHPARIVPEGLLHAGSLASHERRLNTFTRFVRADAGARRLAAFCLGRTTFAWRRWTRWIRQRAILSVTNEVVEMTDSANTMLFALHAVAHPTCKWCKDGPDGCRSSSAASDSEAPLEAQRGSPASSTWSARRSPRRCSMERLPTIDEPESLLDPRSPREEFLFSRSSRENQAQRVARSSSPRLHARAPPRPPTSSMPLTARQKKDSRRRSYGQPHIEERAGAPPSISSDGLPLMPLDVGDGAQSLQPPRQTRCGESLPQFGAASSGGVDVRKHQPQQQQHLLQQPSQQQQFGQQLAQQLAHHSGAHHHLAPCGPSSVRVPVQPFIRESPRMPVRPWREPLAYVPGQPSRARTSSAPNVRTVVDIVVETLQDPAGGALGQAPGMRRPVNLVVEPTAEAMGRGSLPTAFSFEPQTETQRLTGQLLARHTDISPTRSRLQVPVEVHVGSSWS